MITYALVLVHPYPLPPQQQPTHDLAKGPPKIRTDNNRDRKLLPLAIPVQRDGHSTGPRTDQRAQRATKDLIDRHIEARHQPPFVLVHAVDVDQRQRRQQRDMQRAEQSLWLRVREGRAEEEERECEERRGERG